MDSRTQQRNVLLATSISYVVVILDTSIVNVALERISASFASGLGGLQWVVNAYTLTFASLLLSGGTFGDRIGASNVYIAGLATFVGASALCGLAPGLAVLIGARVLQGVGAALLVPAALALINRACPLPRDRAAAFGIWAALGGLAMASGPLIGGVLIGLIGWRSIFLANVPICLAGIVLALRVEADAPAAASRRFDIAGQIAGIAALALLNVTVINVPASGWTSFATLAGFSATLAAFGAFVAIEANHAQPMLPLELFRNHGFTGAVLVSMVSAFTFYGLMFDLGLYFQGARGYSAMHAGEAFLPLTVVVPIGSFLSKRAVAKVGAKGLVCAACLLAATGYFALCAIVVVRGDTLVALPLPAIGLAAALITPAVTTTLMASVENSRSGIAAAVLNAARQTGAVLGVAVSGVLIAMSPSIADGMRKGVLLAGALSVAASAVWWRLSMQPDSVRNGVSGEPG